MVGVQGHHVRPAGTGLVKRCFHIAEGLPQLILDIAAVRTVRGVSSVARQQQPVADPSRCRYACRLIEGGERWGDDDATRAAGVLLHWLPPPRSALDAHEHDLLREADAA